VLKLCVEVVNEGGRIRGGGVRDVRQSRRRTKPGNAGEKETS